MIRPAHVENASIFYAVGNTPAACLSQCHPPDQHLALLLLGCGDARNILHTLYAGAGINRLFDFTCCDIEIEIIARNVVLYTLLVDDVDGTNSQLIWNIYYHTLLDESALEALREQAKKLCGMWTTAEEWHNSAYGQLIRFSNASTFDGTGKMLRFYACNPSDAGPAFARQQKAIKDGVFRSQKLQQIAVSDVVLLTGMRSASPCHQSSIEQVPKLYQNYWKAGTTLPVRSPLKNDNPMFGSTNEKLHLHFGANPHDGFSLATAYAPLSADSPLKPLTTVSNRVSEATRASLAQFMAYGNAFRTAANKITIRFISADALAFCHTLQHFVAKNQAGMASWSRDGWHSEPLVLDSGEYNESSQRSAAPVSFDVIDTSNLLDYLGCLNILTAASPLLSPKVNSTIFTEMLVKRELTAHISVKGLLCGHLPTNALLLGLSPVQYWTNLSLSPVSEENLMRIACGGNSGQFRLTIQWKNVLAPPLQGKSLSTRSLRISNIPAAITYDAKELASLFFRLYQQMLSGETWDKVFGTKKNPTVPRPYQYYTRASLVTILRHVKICEKADMQSFVTQLFLMIMQDVRSHAMDHFTEELSLHLKMCDIFTAPLYSPSMGGYINNLKMGALRNWTNIPPIICVTMLIPHKAISLLEGATSAEFGCPPCEITLRSHAANAKGASDYIFSNLQLSFGTVKTSGLVYTNNFTVRTIEDERGWKGDSPLIVSTMIPTWTAIAHPRVPFEIAFSLKTTTMSFETLTEQNGPPLTVHASFFGQNDVLLSRYRPNMNGNLSVSAAKPVMPLINRADLQLKAAGNLSAKEADAPVFKVSFRVTLNSESKVSHLKMRLDILGGEHRKKLRRGVGVSVKQPSPFSIVVDFGPETPRFEIRPPYPLAMTGAQMKLSRKESHLEFSAAVASMPQDLVARADCLFPIIVTDRRPVLWSLSYLNPDVHPIIDDSSPELEWVTTYLKLMLSRRESAVLYKRNGAPKYCPDARTNLKNSINYLFKHVVGSEGFVKHKSFALKEGESGDIRMIIFVSCIRLDISNQALFLDAALLPLNTPLSPALEAHLSSMCQTGLMSIKVDDAELVFWKYAAAAFVERARSWEHNLATCEYMTRGKAPQSVQAGKEYTCSCGRGKFPPGYSTGYPAAFAALSGHASRVAIPAYFPSPIAEECVGTRGKFPQVTPAGSSGGAANPMTDNTTAILNRIADLSLIIGLDGRTCVACGKTESQNGGVLLKCSACSTAGYCSKACQTRDWKHGNHSQLCMVLRPLGST